MRKLKSSSRYIIQIAKVRINQYSLISINILFVLISYKENQTCCDTTIVSYGLMNTKPLQYKHALGQRNM